MRTIELRFVKHVGKSSRLDYYTIQQRVWGLFGSRWKRLGYYQGSAGGDVWNEYTGDSKKKLLKMVLKQYFEKPKSQVKIIIHPQIKII